MSGSILFLYGPPGSGKSTIGRLLSRSLNVEYLDLDTLIEDSAGKAVSQIFADEGEAGFRKRESEMLTKVASRDSGVIALGGGTLLEEANRQTAEQAGRVVVLDASVKTIHTRISNAPGKRPLLAGELTTKLENLLSARSDHYASFDLRVKTDALTPDQAAWQVQVQTGLFHVRGMAGGAGSSGEYDVRVTPGGLADIGRELKVREMCGPVVLVTDDNVGPVYADKVLASLRQSGFGAEMIQLPAGEEFKNRPVD